MLLYRMTCKEEFDNISNSPSLRNRFSFWSSDLLFIADRVCDEKFTNLVVFEIRDSDLKHFKKQGEFELILDRHNISLIDFRRVL